MVSWADNLRAFYEGLKPLPELPRNISWLHPHQHQEVRSITREFFFKYYDDGDRRTLLLGINPGRFGAGVTGINFTAPKQLEEECGISHSFGKNTELSAEFIYEVIKQYGGAEKFYRHFFIGSISPLGFVKDGKNINYYDDLELFQNVEPFIIRNLDKLTSLNINREICFCIGGEKNYRCLQSLNKKKKWFKEVIPLPHPRFIMQYKRKEKPLYAQHYLELLKKI